MLQRVGMGQLAKRDHVATQLEAEQPLAHQAHVSMARMWEKEQHLLATDASCSMMDGIAVGMPRIVHSQPSLLGSVELCT
jgi:hypothetical protein